VKHKIVLYNPQAVFYTMPLGVLAVASQLDREQFDVRIIDGRLESNPVETVLRETRDALCLGVSVLTGAPLKDALKVLRAVKQERPEIITVCGGWHPSLFPAEMLAEPSIDATVQGQGELTFRDLTARLAQDAGLEGVAGLAYRDEGGVRLNPPRPLTRLELLKPPDFGFIPVERYFALKGQRQLDYITSIGCPFRCAFCADPFVYQRRWSGMGADHLGSHLAELHSRYRFCDLNFQDETFFTYKKRVAAIAEEFLRRKFDFTWAATMRADQGVRLSEEHFALCVRSGLRRVLIGVESGSERMLERIKKDTRVEQVLQSAAMCARHGVAVIFSFIVGFPGESENDLRDTLALVKELRAMSPRFETPIFYYKPYPGSELGADVLDQIPKTLDEWGDFDYVQGAAGPWVTSETYRLVERFKFYNRHAWGQRAWHRWPLTALSRWRCRHNYFDWPVEKLILERINPAPDLS
jgi:radical SAM superfamily enzyme YgiQ (UPF0313 family)